MKKIVSGIIGFILVASSLLAQPSISCPGVSIFNGQIDTVSICTGCTTLTATTVSGFATNTYTVQQIPFNPWPTNGPNTLSITTDDVYSGIINLPFSFCFFGTNYNQCVLGSNGVLTFDLTTASGFCPWVINAGIPSPAVPMNSILFPFHDIDPSIVQAGQTRSYNFGLYGTAPCRVLVVSLVNIPMYGCGQNIPLNATQQLVLYENTNIIETYILNKQVCASHNAGSAIHGLQNATGTTAVVVPGRNFPAQWTATNDAWRFVPAGPPTNTVQWFELGNPVALGNTGTLQVCPQTTTTYIAQGTYSNCNGSTLAVFDTITAVVSQQISLNSTIVDVNCPGASTGSISLAVSGGAGPLTYTWSNPGLSGPTVTGLAAGTYYLTITDTLACGRQDSFVVQAPPTFNLATSVVNAPCFAGQGSASVNVAGGTPGYTYQWLPSGGSNAIATNLNAGNYSVIITDANNCRDTSTVTITQPTAVASSASMTPANCFNSLDGTLSALANGGVGNYTFFWLPINQTGANISGVPAGNYNVIATDSNGCVDTASVTVTQPTQVAVALTSVNVSCAGGNNGSATAVGSGGSPGFTYAWSNGGTGPQINNLVSNTYTVTASDSHGCTATNTVSVLQPSPLNAQTFSTNETCAGFCDGTVSVVASGGTTPYSYAWSLGGNPTAPTVQGVCSGTYNVTVTDGNGCQFTTNVTVVPNPSPFANAGADVSFCEGSGGTQLSGSSSGGGGAPYYYTWTCATPPCGLSCQNCANPFANPTDSMMYYLVVTDQNGCSSEPDSVMVNVIPRPRVDAGPDTAICGVPAPCTVLSPTILVGFGPFQYNWIPGTGLNDSTIANPCARPDTTTIYALVVTDLATGCTSEFTTTDTVSTITVSVSPSPLANGGPDRVICEGDTTLLTGLGTGAGPVYDYEWSPTTGLSNPNIINPLAFPSATTEYFLTVWSNGCASIADPITVFVTEIPTVDAGANRDLCLGDSTLLDGSAVVSNQVIPDSIISYVWSPAPGLSGTTTEDVMASPATTGYYYLNVMTARGCENLDSVLVTVNPTPIVDAGQTFAVCEGTGPWDLTGTINWYQNVQPGDLQNIIIEWQPTSNIVGPNDEVDVTVTTDSTMYFYFTVTYNTCSHTDSVLVLVFNEVIATATADTNTICQGDSVLLTATGGIGGGTFTWTPTNGLADPTSATTLAAPDSTTTYTVSVFEGGCSDSAEVTVNVIPAPVVAFLNSFTEGCVPLEVSFTAVTENATLYSWYFGDSSEVENSTQPFHTYDAPGTYEVTLLGTGIGGCSSMSAPVIITVHDSIHAEFSSNPNFPVELALPEGQVAFFDETDNSVGWNWTFGDGGTSTLQNPTHNYSQPGSYYVTMAVVNEFGCWSEVTHGPFIMVAPDLFIPNVFSPNGDGMNDEFFVDYTGSQPFLLKIFDRWGVQMFETRNKVDGWDGTPGTGEAMDGVYYYTLFVGDREFTGNITLVR